MGPKAEPDFHPHKIQSIKSVTSGSSALSRKKEINFNESIKCIFEGKRDESMLKELLSELNSEKSTVHH